MESKDLIHLMLYGNLCRTADQMSIMMMHDYPDGTLRLWRVLYEYAVVAVFLMKHNNNDLAVRFEKATVKEDKRAVWKK